MRGLETIKCVYRPYGGVHHHMRGLENLTKLTDCRTIVHHHMRGLEIPRLQCLK